MIKRINREEAIAVIHHFSLISRDLYSVLSLSVVSCTADILTGVLRVSGAGLLISGMRRDLSLLKVSEVEALTV